MPKEYFFFRDTRTIRESLADSLESKAIEITYSTIRKHLGDLREWKKENGYAHGGLVLWKDWSVHFYKSSYLGKTCYMINLSGINYVFLKEQDINSQSIRTQVDISLPCLSIAKQIEEAFPEYDFNFTEDTFTITAMVNHYETANAIKGEIKKFISNLDEGEN